MKKITILLIVAVLSLPAFAQEHGKHHGKKHKDITELVSDLSQIQKHKIDNITRESKDRMVILRKQQKAVRDSISTYMNLDGDQSEVIFQLFEREASLQTAINREMYGTKLAIDEVLTKEQRAEVRRAASNNKRGNPKRKNNVPTKNNKQ